MNPTVRGNEHEATFECLCGSTVEVPQMACLDGQRFIPLAFACRCGKTYAESAHEDLRRVAEHHAQCGSGDHVRANCPQVGRIR